jgi:hypothetical protein
MGTITSETDITVELKEELNNVPEGSLNLEKET